jgi:hypothetical protein
VVAAQIFLFLNVDMTDDRSSVERGDTSGIDLRFKKKLKVIVQKIPDKNNISLLAWNCWRRTRDSELKKLVQWNMELLYLRQPHLFREYIHDGEPFSPTETIAITSDGLS